MRPGDLFAGRQQCTGDASGRPRMVIPGHGFAGACGTREVEHRRRGADFEILRLDRIKRTA